MNLRADLGLLNTSLKKEKKGLAFLFFLCLLNVILQLLGPAVLGAFSQRSVRELAHGGLYALAKLFLFLSLAWEGIQVLCALWTQNIGWRTTNHLRFSPRRFETMCS
ncbi:hypothetical protein ABB02_00008 [Clostridiaceae bacterium JG1575]|nr:hypothetical protein ABB02_00008 [Clostridiaceae bacterium JG1575]